MAIDDRELRLQLLDASRLADCIAGGLTKQNPTSMEGITKAAIALDKKLASLVCKVGYPTTGGRRLQDVPMPF